MWSSRCWGLYNYEHKVEASLGLCERMMEALGPHVMGAAPQDLTDPNLDPGHRFLDEDDEAFDSRFIPRFISTVSAWGESPYTTPLPHLLIRKEV